MKNKLPQGIIITFLATLAIFTLSKSDLKQKMSSSFKAFFHRNLGEKTIKEVQSEICDKSSTDLLDFYKNQNGNYTFKVTEGNELVPEIFNKDIVNGVSEEKQKEYLMSNSGYLFLLIFWGICIILWIPFCCCVCCRSCICLKPCTGCPTLILLLSLFSSGVVVILCSAGYTGNSGIMNGIFGFGCSVLKLEDHLARGDEYKVKPYWIGLAGISSIMNKTVSNINNLGIKATELKNNLINIDSLSFKNELDTEYDDKKDKKLSNPSPDSEEFTPFYLLLYGPPTNKEKTLGLIETEFTTFENTSKELLLQMIEIVNLSNSNTEDITSKLSEFQTYIDDVVEKADGYITSTVGNYIDYLDQADSKFRASMNALFSFNLILGLCLTAALVLLLLLKVGKCFLCFAWIFLYILMIFTLLCGIVFGIAGTIFEDVAYGSSCLLPNIRNVSVIEDQNTMDLVDTCLNGNGSIANEGMIDLSSSSLILDAIYSLDGNITEGITKFQEYELASIQQGKENYDKISSNLKQYISELSSALNSIRQYIDTDVAFSKVSVETPFYDSWEVNKTTCPDGYTYLPPPSSNRLRNLLEEGNKYCLIISEWKKSDIISRYNNIKTTEGNSTSTVAESYYDSILTFLEENDELMGDIKEKIEYFKKPFKEFVGEEVEILNGIRDAVKPIRETFEEIIGDDNSILDMLNCGFLKRDIYKILQVMHDSLGGEFITISKLFIWISVIEFILTFFVLILMSSFKQNNSNDIENGNK